ncbi:sugar ABC transporter substrate-binding protein [Candidatus Dojkabacteria bacterium]|uniref:Sugar ABC transporter substrate-binding protein n=1 Tax=Candidatus Dojkabacteria bacterium TaxID=2099670 RepID=A0A847VCW7_9BACT|nr:sugar ABC transporter substrate-binding protein [Candidatus Dojkabacteria bacterium]
MDSKQKKLIIVLSITAGVLLLLNVILFALTRSGEKKPEEITLVYWGFWEEAEVMHPLLEKYEAENPGVKIFYSKQTSKNYESRTYTRLEQGVTDTEPVPDILMIHNTWLPKFQQYLTSLPSSIIDRNTYSQEFYPTALDDFTGRDGGIYAIPLQIDGLMIIYNKSLLSKEGYAEPPQDWDSFLEAAKRLTKYDSTGRIAQAGLAIGTSKNITHATDILTYFMLQNGAELINRERDEVNLTSQRAISALDVYTSYAKEEFPTWGTYLPSDLTFFQNGNLAMMFGTTWQALNILEEMDELSFGLAPLPILPSNKHLYYPIYWGNAVSKASKNQIEAWKFLQFLSEPEQLRRLYQNSAKTRTFGQPYSRTSMNEELLLNEYTQPLGLMAPYMKSWQVGDLEFVQEVLTRSITSITEGNKDLESVFRTAQNEINERLAVTNK